MQPKAKWTTSAARPGVWTADLGMYVMYAETNTGQCSIFAERCSPSPGGGSRFVLWNRLVPTPCDAPDLMRLCEEELARRLHAVADTMAGDEIALPRETPSTYPVDCVAISLGGVRLEHTEQYDVEITSYTQLFDTLDRLPTTLEIERTCTDGRWLWRKVDCDFYAMAQERAGIAQVKYYSRDDLDNSPYPEGTACRVVRRPVKGNI